MDLVDFDEAVFDGIVEEFEDFAATLGRARRDVHPDLRAAGRQRRRALGGDALVSGSAAALPPRARPHRLRSQPDRRALPRAVGDPPAREAARRLPRLRGSGRRRRHAPGRRGRRAAERAAHEDRRDRHVRRAGRRRRSRRCRSRCGSSDDIDVESRLARSRARRTSRRSPSSFECLLCWMSEQPLSPNRRYLVKHTTRTATVSAMDVRYRIDARELHRDESATTLELNDLGRVRMELSSPLVFDSYRRNRVTGSLIVIDEATNETVAAGVILDTEVEVEDAPAESRDRRRARTCSWQRSELTRERRWESLGHRRRDDLVHGPAGRRQVDDRGRRRGAPGRRRPAGVPARRRQPAPRPQRRPRVRRGTRAVRTCAAPRTSRGCSRSPARSRS